MSDDTWASVAASGPDVDEFARAIIDAYCGYMEMTKKAISMSDFVNWLDEQTDSGMAMHVLGMNTLKWLNVTTVK